MLHALFQQVSKLVHTWGALPRTLAHRQPPVLRQRRGRHLQRDFAQGAGHGVCRAMAKYQRSCKGLGVSAPCAGPCKVSSGKRCTRLLVQDPAERVQ